jgi:hypothetical protein
MMGTGERNMVLFLQVAACPMRGLGLRVQCVAICRMRIHNLISQATNSKYFQLSLHTLQRSFCPLVTLRSRLTGS